MAHPKGRHATQGQGVEQFWRPAPQRAGVDDFSPRTSWGETLAAAAGHLQSQLRTVMRVVQLKGEHSHSECSTKDNGTLTGSTHAADAKIHMFPHPLIFDSTEAKEWMLHDGRSVHMLTLGVIGPSWLLPRVQQQYCSTHAFPSIDAPTAGIPLEDLAPSQPVRAAIAGRAAKTGAIHPALTMNLATYLVIDHELSQRVISS